MFLNALLDTYVQQPMECCIKVTLIDLSDVYRRDKFYNVNNADPKPDDYFDDLKRFHTIQWLHQFHGNNVPSITLDANDVKWMVKASSAIGILTGRFSHIYDDELEHTYQKHIQSVPPCPPEGWFIRCDRVSLKGGMYGVGPYKDLRNILKSMVTSNIGHECVTQHEELTAGCSHIYFMKWQNINPDKEFRVFIHNNTITAISQQHLYTVNEWLRLLTPCELQNVANFIIRYFNTFIRDKLLHLGGSYTMDFAILTDPITITHEQPITADAAYFIEVNSFGAHYAAGSALFNWTHDNDQLTGVSADNVVEFRFVATESDE